MDASQEPEVSAQTSAQTPAPRGTLKDYTRDSVFGYFLRFASRGAIYKHPEEQPGWQPPTYWKTHSEIEREKAESAAAGPSAPTEKVHNDNSDSNSSQHTAVDQDAAAVGSTGEKNGNENKAPAQEPAPGKSLAAHEKTMSALANDNDYITVDWYGPDDPANPQNWPQYQKFTFMGILMWLTFVVYMGAAVITPGIPDIENQFGVSTIPATLTLGLYVLGYGLGPLIFSPLTEIPAVGRLPFYFGPLLLFFIVNFATLFSPTFGGLLASRLITGFLASPALATGGGSIQDVFSPLMMPLGLCLWVVAAYQGPGLGPTISGFAVERFGTWRWTIIIYQIFVITTIPTIGLLMPESSASNILYRRAQRVRKATGNDRYRSRGEILQSHMTAGAIFNDAIIKPFEIFFKDPSVAYIHIYVSLLYSFYYLFFASFPIIFFEGYGFGIGTGELPYVSFAVGGSLFCAAYMAMYRYIVVPAILSGNAGEPEDALAPAIPAAFLSMGSLFGVAWSANRTQYMACIIFSGVFAGANFVLLQPLFAYLAMSYPVYAASIFALNDFLRSTLAFALLNAGDAMYRRLGIGGGNSFLAGLVGIMIPPLLYIKANGKKLRQRSKFAVVQ